MEQPPLPIQFQMGGSPQSYINASNQTQKNNELVNFSYVNKFKTAFYGFVLYILFSQKITFKIINMILGLLTNKAEIIDDNDEPLPLGLFINGCIIAIILFIF